MSLCMPCMHTEQTHWHNNQVILSSKNKDSDVTQQSLKDEYWVSQLYIIKYSLKKKASFSAPHERHTYKKRHIKTFKFKMDLVFP